MKKNRAEKIVVKREREWSETELLGKKRMAEAVLAGIAAATKREIVAQRMIAVVAGMRHLPKGNFQGSDYSAITPA